MGFLDFLAQGGNAASWDAATQFGLVGGKVGEMNAYYDAAAENAEMAERQRLWSPQNTRSNRGIGGLMRLGSTAKARAL